MRWPWSTKTAKGQSGGVNVSGAIGSVAAILLAEIRIKRFVTNYWFDLVLELT
jgi:hypothetical protein